MYRVGSLLALVFWGCFDAESVIPIDGTTVNSITVVLVHENGTPASGIEVRLRPSRFLSGLTMPGPEMRDGITNSEGRLRLDSLPRGQFTLEARNERVGILWRFSILPTSIRDTIIYETKDDTLRPLGSIQGRQVLPAESHFPPMVEVFGTEHYALVDSAGFFAIPGLPPGRYDLHATQSPDTSLSNWGAVILFSGDSTFAGVASVGPYPEWKKSGTVQLNPVSAGVGLTQPVLGFPILVRLDSSNFPFQEAYWNGGDVRFAKVDGTPLKFEIERWNNSLGHAEIWMNWDTVFAGIDNQSIRMYWDCPRATLPVFHSPFAGTFGYKAVWHLGEQSSGIGNVGIYRDASGNGNSGDDSVSSLGKEGVIGLGQEFNGVDDIIPMSGFITSFANQSFSISLWLKPLENGGTILGQYGGNLNGNNGGNILFLDSANHVSISGSGRGITVMDSAVDTIAWHHVSVEWSFTGLGTGSTRFYLDGNPGGLRINTYGPGVDSLGFRVFLGRPNGLESLRYFKGWMDEVRISDRIRGPDWIRLEYLNQRPGSGLCSLIIP